MNEGGTGRIKVLSIIGWGRSGSTLLTNILGEIDGFFGAGELHYLWQRGLISNRICGCHAHVRDCEVWKSVTGSTVFTDAMGGRTPEDVVALQQRFVKMSNLRKMLALKPGSPTGEPDLDAYLDLLDSTYRAIASTTGAKVIVDSSKRPINAAVIRLLPNVDLYVMHLVRDPRGVAFSRQRKKSAFGHVMAQHNAANSTVRWLYRNRTAEKVRALVPPERQMLLRYEDFVTAPRERIAEVVALLDEHPPALPFVDDHTVELGPNHVASGNQSRFRSGRIEINPDQSWVSEQKAADRLVATSLALPLLAHYGYVVRPRAGGGAVTKVR